MPLHEWETFYVIVGSSAAALTGLQFVVIALSADVDIGGGEVEFAAFATPNIVHFSGVLLISAMLSMPGQGQTSLAWCIGITGLLGLAYAIYTTNAARQSKDYTPVLEDWIFHSILPILTYLTLLISGCVVRSHPDLSLHLIGVTSLVLLYIGIHNAWDTALFMALAKKKIDREARRRGDDAN